MFGFGGRRIAQQSALPPGGWSAMLRQAPTEWEQFRLVAG